MAFNSPPLLSGGGVFWVKKSNPSAGMPLRNSDHMMRNNTSNPAPVAAKDSDRMR